MKLDMIMKLFVENNVEVSGVILSPDPLYDTIKIH